MCAERVYLIPPQSTSTAATASAAESSTVLALPDISILIKEWLTALPRKQQTSAESVLNKLRKSEVRWNEDGRMIYPNSDTEDTPGSHITHLLDWLLKRQTKTKPIDVDLFVKYLKKGNDNVDIRFNLKFPDNWVYLYK